MNEQEIHSLNNVAEAQKEMRVDLKIDYLDDDIIMIDNVKMLSEPSATRMQMNAFVVCYAGRAQFELNGVTKKLSANQALICPPNTVFSNFLLSPDLDLKMIFLTDRILHSFLREKMNIWTRALYISRLHIFNIGQDQREGLELFNRMLNLNLNTQIDHPYRTDIMQSLLRVAVLGICGTLEMMLKKGDYSLLADEQLPPNEATFGPAVVRTSSQVLFQRFLNMLNNTTPAIALCSRLPTSCASHRSICL